MLHGIAHRGGTRSRPEASPVHAGLACVPAIELAGTGVTTRRPAGCLLLGLSQERRKQTGRRGSIDFMATGAAPGLYLKDGELVATPAQQGRHPWRSLALNKSLPWRVGGRWLRDPGFHSVLLAPGA